MPSRSESAGALRGRNVRPAPDVSLRVDDVAVRWMTSSTMRASTESRALRGPRVRHAIVRGQASSSWMPGEANRCDTLVTWRGTSPAGVDSVEAGVVWSESMRFPDWQILASR